MQRALFCFGLGYSAGFLARRLAHQGWAIAGTSPDGPPRPSHCSVLSVRSPCPMRRAMSGYDASSDLDPPDAAGCPVFDCHGAEIAALRQLRWIGYLSSTNVYGDCAGGWVDETMPTEPSGERGRRRVVAEAAWRARSASAAAFRCKSFALLAFTVPAAASSTRCVPAPRGGS